MEQGARLRADVLDARNRLMWAEVGLGQVVTDLQGEEETAALRNWVAERQATISKIRLEVDSMTSEIANAALVAYFENPAE